MLLARYNDGAASEGFADVDGGGFGLFFKAFTGNPPWDPTAAMSTWTSIKTFQARRACMYILDGLGGQRGELVGHANPAPNNARVRAGLPRSRRRPDRQRRLSTWTLRLFANLGNGNPINYEQYTVAAIAPAGTVERSRSRYR